MTTSGIFAVANQNLNSSISTGNVDVNLEIYKDDNGEEVLYGEDTTKVMPGDKLSFIPKVNNLAEDCYVRFKVDYIDECVSTGNQDTLISAMDESGNPYPGFVFRVANGGQLEISANVTNSLKANPRYNRNATSVAIRRIDGILYASINGGAFSQVLDMNSIQAFDSNLAIGASLNGSGNPQRYFKGTLSDINIIFDD